MSIGEAVKTHHNSAMITDRQTFTTKLPSMGCLVSIFTVSINSESFPWVVRFAQERYLPKFCNVQCPILCIKTNSTLQCWCGLATDIWKKSRLSWKLKISNAADNADFTRGLRVDHFNYPTRAHSRWCYLYPYPTRAENFYPTRPTGMPVFIAFPYDYRTISVKPMARGRTARVTNPNVIWLYFDCECRQVDINRLLGGKLISSDGKNRLKSTLKRLGHRLSAVIGLYKFILLFSVQLVVWVCFKTNVLFKTRFFLF